MDANWLHPGVSIFIHMAISRHSGIWQLALVRIDIAGMPAAYADDEQKKEK